MNAALEALRHPKALLGLRAKDACGVRASGEIFARRYNSLGEFSWRRLVPEVSKLLEQALALSVEEQEALAESLISNLGGKVDEAVLAAWDEEIRKRIADLDSGKAKTIPWAEVRQRNLAKLPRAQ